MDRAQIEVKLQELYVGILGRAADFSGLSWWADQIEQGTRSFEHTRADFTSNKQPEYWGEYGDLSNSSLVDNVYKNFLEREPDVGGKAYWVEELDSGAVTADFLIKAIINAAQDPSATDPRTITDASVIANKVEAATYFTLMTKTPTGFPPKFLESAKAAVSMVNADISTISASKAATDLYADSIPVPEIYDDRAMDAPSGVGSAPVLVTETTHVQGVLGLQYATGYDEADTFTFTASETGYFALGFYGGSRVYVNLTSDDGPVERSYMGGRQSGEMFFYQGNYKVQAGQVVKIEIVGAQDVDHGPLGNVYNLFLSGIS